MSIYVIIGFGLAMTLSLGGAVWYWGHGIAARNSAVILARFAAGEGAPINDLQQVAGLPLERLAVNARLQKLLKDVPFVQQLAEILDESGESTTVAQLVSYMAALAMGLSGLAYHNGCHPPAAMFLGLVSACFPVVYFRHLGARRATAFEAQLPQALELISLYLRSGRSLPQAFLATADEIAPPAAQEFAVCAEEYRLGRTLEVALKNLAVKYPGLVGLRLFAVSVSVLGQTGGNLVEVLERIKKTLDAGIAYTLKLRASTGEARTSANILGVVPGLFMAITGILNPVYFNAFFETTPGLVLFSLFLFFWISGLVWVRAMMQSKG